MARSELFISDALSALGRALIARLPRGYSVQAWTAQAVTGMDGLPRNVVLHTGAMDSFFELPTQAAQAKHVVFVTDAFYKKSSQSLLTEWAALIKKTYETCEDGQTESFVFVSTAAVYADSKQSVSEFSDCRPLYGAARVALEIEAWLKEASKNRSLKPIILRIANPYGPHCPSIAHMLFQQAVVISTVRTTIPRFYKGPRCPLIHVDDVARAVYFLMEREGPREQIFNLADDDCMRIGEMFAVVGQTVNLPELRGIILPHATSLPILLRFLSGCGLAAPLDRLIARVWRQVCFCYGLDPTPPPSIVDFISASAWPSISSSRIHRMGFTLAHPSFRTSVGDLYRRMIDDHWLPDLSKPPCRTDALINRVYFRQRWNGFIVDASSPNESKPFVLTIDNDMPLWATHSFSEAPFHGTVSIGDRPQISFEGMRRVRHLSDVSTFDNASFTMSHDGMELTFQPESGGHSSFAPYQKFSLVDDAGRTRHTGKMTLDLSPKAVLACLRSVTFQNH